MIDEVCRENREKFESEGKEKLDFLPNKYFQKYQVEASMTDYDHPMLYRDKDFDYLIISLYPGARNTQVLSEGFHEIPPMYSISCRSYVKKFKNTKSSRIEELIE